MFIIVFSLTGFIKKLKKYDKIVVYPIKEAWSVFDPYNSTKIEELDKEMKQQIRAYRKRGITFLIVPDYLIENGDAGI